MYELGMVLANLGVVLLSKRIRCLHKALRSLSDIESKQNAGYVPRMKRTDVGYHRCFYDGLYHETLFSVKIV